MGVQSPTPLYGPWPQQAIFDVTNPVQQQQTKTQNPLLRNYSSNSERTISSRVVNKIHVHFIRIYSNEDVSTNLSVESFHHFNKLWIKQGRSSLELHVALTISTSQGQLCWHTPHWSRTRYKNPPTSQTIQPLHFLRKCIRWTMQQQNLSFC